MFFWLDRIGNEKTIIPEESNCNQKSSVLKSDHVQITDKSALPVMKIYYGPLEYEMDQMKIVVGSLGGHSTTEFCHFLPLPPAWTVFIP